MPAFLANAPRKPPPAIRSRSAGAARSNCLLRVRGVQGHAAYPDKARNPSARADRCAGLLKMKPLDAGSEHFQPSNLEITSIDTGNPATNVIPASATARFNIRFNDLHTAESLKAWIEAQVSAALRRYAASIIRSNTSRPPIASSQSREASSRSLSDAVEAETRPRAGALDRQAEPPTRALSRTLPRSRAWPPERDGA